ncbi:CPBP family intramembrane metalloprotease [Candidatus Saccharibacteria bacterium]|nr:CPBP family intramembrane metalloprotease [Candidatus Saccharibacteria bacterium]
MKKAPSIRPKKTTKKQVLKLVSYIVFLLTWVAAAAIASQLIVGSFLTSILSPEALGQPVWTAVYSAISYVLAMALIVLAPIAIIRAKNKREDENALYNINEIDHEELGFKNYPTWTDIGLAVVGFLIYLVVSAGIMYLFSLFPWFNAEETQNVGFSYYLIGFDRLVAFVTLVVVAPIAEEIIFRGWLYGKMRNALLSQLSDQASMIISILLVSILFGLLHMQWNVGVNVFALSLVLCGLREVTGTIHAGIMLHMVKNGVAFYMLYVLGVM